ncbi:MAG: hypothetical protein GEU28_13990, partial [Dehalococcoidia bacterium]|nr:hypothetical protein [Dehalococcoidia bacterium]
PEMRGISLEIAANREYLSGELLAPIVGYIGPINQEEYTRSQEDDGDDAYGLGDRVGRTGIEQVYEDELRGDDGQKLIEQDALGRQLRLVDEEDPVPGDKVVLALDYGLQTATETALRQAMEDTGAPIATAVVMDVKTGEVVAMVSLPSYDANIFTEGIPQSQLDALEQDTEGRPLVNHAIADAFPPGSVFKVITAAAALEFGSVNAETRINSEGGLVVENESGVEDAGQRFNDTARGTFTFPQGIAASSNVYFYCLVAAGQPGSQFFNPPCGPDEFEGTGPGNLARMSHGFGLGAATEIDLPGETTGLIPPRDQDGDPANVDDDLGETNPDEGLTNLSAWFAEISGFENEPWRLGSTLQFAIGQNVVTTTPIQMAVVAAAIANGGQVLQPRLVHDIVGADGVSQETRTLEGREVQIGAPIVRGTLPVSPENLAIIQQGMYEAVNATGYPVTANLANPAVGVEIAGKTGSPEVGETDLSTGKLLTHAWFIGYGPHENAEIAVAVYVQGGTGGETAAPVARAIFEAWFNRVSVRALP